MKEIIPAFIPNTFFDLKDAAAVVKQYSKTFHVDVMDSSCTPKNSWPYNDNDTNFKNIQEEKEGLPYWDDLSYEVHIMMKNPKDAIVEWFKAGASRIVIHADYDIPTTVLEPVKGFMDITIAILPSTPIEKLDQWIPFISGIQIMGSDHIGESGIMLDEKALEMAKKIQEKYPNIPLAIDIGVNEETVDTLIQAGFSKLITNSWFWESEEKEALVKWV